MTINRREFFGAAPAAIVPSLVQIAEPEKAYVIMAQDWDYNDEYNYENGEHLADSRIYYDKAEAEARAQVLNDAFFGDKDLPGAPDRWHLDWESIGTDNWEGYDHNLQDTYSWNDLLSKSDYRAPYRVRELTDSRKQPLPDPDKDIGIANAQWDGNTISVQDYMAKQAN